MFQKKQAQESIATYLSTRRKTVTLSSGVTVTIRKIHLEDVLACGRFPAAFVKAKKQGRNEEARDMIEAIEGFAEMWATASIIAGVVGPFRVTEKMPADANNEAGEISIHDLDDVDRVLLLREISTFNGIGETAAATAAPFHGEQETTS